jgi:hypothetical protein
VDGVGGNRNTLRGLLGSFGGLRATSLAGCESQSRSGSVGLCQCLASADSCFSYRADCSGSVDFLSLGGRSRSRLSGLHATTLAASDNKSACGSVCECVALLDGGYWAHRSRGVDGFSACGVGSRLGRRRNPGRRRDLGGLGAASLAAGDGQNRRQSSGLCVGLASAGCKVGCRTHSGGEIGDEGRGCVVLSRRGSNR